MSWGSSVKSFPEGPGRFPVWESFSSPSAGADRASAFPSAPSRAKLSSPSSLCAFAASPPASTLPSAVRGGADGSAPPLPSRGTGTPHPGRDAGSGLGRPRRQGVRRVMANVKVAVRVRPLSKRCGGARSGSGGGTDRGGHGHHSGEGGCERRSGAVSGDREGAERWLRWD